MSVKSTYVAVGIFLSLFVAKATCRVTCSGDNWWDTYYCNDGYDCCGETACCWESSFVSSTGLAVWSYVGIVIGSIVCLIILVSIIGAICCTVLNKQTHAGRVIQPVGGTTAQVITTVQNPQGYSIPAQSMAFVQPLSGPSAPGQLPAPPFPPFYK